jgi:hypothetical protein
MPLLEKFSGPKSKEWKQMINYNYKRKLFNVETQMKN